MTDNISKPMVALSMTMMLYGVKMRDESNGENMKVYLDLPARYDFGNITPEAIAKLFKERIIDIISAACQDVGASREEVTDMVRVLYRTYDHTWTQEEFNEEKKKVDAALSALRNAGYQEI